MRPRLLLVDDEQMLLNALRRLLGREFEVCAEVRPQDALARLERGETFDVILCDLMMPEMTGVEFYQALPAAHRSRTIFMTGGTPAPEAGAFLASVANPRLDKPFAPEQLRALIRAVLDCNAA